MNCQLSDLKKIAVKFAILFCILFTLDYTLGTTLKYYYFKNTSGLFYRTTYVIDSTSAETLVFGSSRANHHYVPQVFEDELNSTFYDCGRDGVGLIFEAALVKAVTKRYKPKRIILDLLPNEFSYDETDKLSPLLPYKNNPAIYPFILENSSFEPIKLLSRIYPYNSMLSTIIIGNLAINKKRREDMKGFIKLDGTMENVKPVKANDEYAKIILKKTIIFEDLLTYLNKMGIICYVMISPDYAVFNQNPTEKLAEEYCRNNNVHFIDFINRQDYLGNYTLFHDPYHLNETGALKFSKEVCADIKTLENN